MSRIRLFLSDRLAGKGVHGPDTSFAIGPLVDSLLWSGETVEVVV